jgi:hypothetical protein
MSAREDRVLWCIIEGDFKPFQVTVPGDSYVTVLKEAIVEKRKYGALRSIDATDLTVWKVIPRPVK